MITEAESALRRAASFGAPGRFQIEAAIQSTHTDRLRGGCASWRDVVGFYDLLLKLAPSVGAAVGRAAALVEAGQTEAAIASLDTVASVLGERLSACQPYWAVRGEAYCRAGRHTDAQSCLTRAIGLTADPAVRAYLASKLIS
jgi:RNA polymerase sigma-70 factor (ECF subfamily)